MPLDDDPDRAISAGAARRLVRYAKANHLPAQVAYDIGVVIGRLARFEGSDWLDPPARADK
jgi:hypothetical protein